ncbi:hypothetical protein Pcinc_043141 [Petrolisthes cinctipes]|uniref:Uncharacterized protein n=1 Tax=Petrolisthes cinctipes TaxID=88211 RepID=A0AAE1EI61_PETCI|nr:hypothetical protein Pcinc_043141 [Petrolisthes cinctipes]
MFESTQGCHDERVGGHPSSLGPITSIGGVGGSASFASTPRIHTPTTDFQPPYFPPPYLGTENQMTVSGRDIALDTLIYHTNHTTYNTDQPYYLHRPTILPTQTNHTTYNTDQPYYLHRPTILPTTQTNHTTYTDQPYYLQHRPTILLTQTNHTTYNTDQHILPTTQTNTYYLQHRPTILPTTQTNHTTYNTDHPYYLHRPTILTTQTNHTTYNTDQPYYLHRPTILPTQTNHSTYTDQPFYLHRPTILPTQTNTYYLHALACCMAQVGDAPPCRRPLPTALPASQLHHLHLGHTPEQT